MDKWARRRGRRRKKKGVNGVVPGNHLQWQYTMEVVGGCRRGRQSTIMKERKVLMWEDVK